MPPVVELSASPTVTELMESPDFVKALNEIEKAAEETPVVSGEETDETQSGTDAAKDGEREVASEHRPAADKGEAAAGGVAKPVEDEESWIDDDAKELAASYGITEERLKKFSSKEDFENAASLYDEQLLGRGRKPAGQEKVDVIAAPAAAQQQPPPVKPEPTKPAPATNKADRFDIEALQKQGFDEHSLKLFEQVNAERDRNDRLEQELSQFKPIVETFQQQQEQLARSQQQQVVYQFHANTDTLPGQDSRFGKAIDETGRFLQVTAEQKANRDRLWGTANQMATEILASGRPLPPMPVLLKRAMSHEFATELLAERKAEVRTNIQKQSATRRPVGKSKAIAPVPITHEMSPNEQVKQIVNNPDFVRQMNAMEAEVGAR